MDTKYILAFWHLARAENPRCGRGVHSIVVAARARTFFLRLRNFDALLAPYFQLAILRDLPVALVLGNRDGALAVRRRAQGVPRRRPEIERRAVSHDLPAVVR